MSRCKQQGLEPLLSTVTVDDCTIQRTILFPPHPKGECRPPLRDTFRERTEALSRPHQTPPGRLHLYMGQPKGQGLVSFGGECGSPGRLGEREKQPQTVILSAHEEIAMEEVGDSEAALEPRAGGPSSPNPLSGSWKEGLAQCVLQGFGEQIQTW
jgi:hypothetical protein